MFTKKDKVYADAGFVLREKATGIISFQSIGTPQLFEELPVNLNEITVNENICLISGGAIAHMIEARDYDGIKSEWVKKRYSNDDQIAVMLNQNESQEEKILLTKMQEWRIFSANISKAILARITG